MTTDVINVPRELRSVLSMILSALDRDAAEGKTVRGEMAEELRRILTTAQPAADGEREAFEAWAASVGYHTERDMFQREKYQSSLTWELWRVWQARAAQPQQAVAVTDEVRRLREVLEHCKDELRWMIDKHNAQSQEDGSWLYDYQTVAEADAALSAHKTGEEE